LATSVKSRTRGIDPDIDYDHKADPAKGHQAAGWVKDADVRSDGLYLKVDFTADATKDVQDKKYRYFSADFADTWTDPQGVEHKDVLMGGGLTNRPYMKNLMPVNLSELRFDEPSKEETEVDGKKLRESLGLAETVTDEVVFAKLTENATTITTLTADKVALTAELDKIKNPGPDLMDPELKKLVEASPAMKALVESLEKEKALSEQRATALKLAEVTNQISDVQKGKTFALAPAVKEDLKQLLLKASPEASKLLVEFMGKVVNGDGLVDLSERGFTGRRENEAGDATFRFNEQVKTLMNGDDKMTFADAVEKVAASNPRLYSEYREASYGFKA
jgi:phage I-like protein